MEKVKVSIGRHKVTSDFSVKVTKPNHAPQIFVNVPVATCLERCQCTQEQIKNAEIFEDKS